MSRTVDLRIRSYGPLLGRFVQSDPLPWWMQRHGVASSYAYAYDNPLRFVDRWGLQGTVADPTTDPPPSDGEDDWLARWMGSLIIAEYLVGVVRTLAAVALGSMFQVVVSTIQAVGDLLPQPLLQSVLSALTSTGDAVAAAGEALPKLGAVEGLLAEGSGLKALLGRQVILGVISALGTVLGLLQAAQGVLEILDAANTENDAERAIALTIGVIDVASGLSAVASGVLALTGNLQAAALLGALSALLQAGKLVLLISQTGGSTGGSEGHNDSGSGGNPYPVSYSYQNLHG